MAILKKIPLLILFSLIFLTFNASAIELCGTKKQGEIMMGKAPNAEKILFNGKKIDLTENGEFIIAFSRDEDKPQTLAVDDIEYKFNIEKQKWDIQKVNGLPQKTVTPSEKDQKDIEREYTDIRGAIKKSIEKPMWLDGFIKPVEGRTSGNFGGQRIMNGVAKNPHQGWDIAAPEGTKVKAPADGIITLADKNYFYSGNVMVIDHGFGLFTIYAHMKDLNVKKGDAVKQGQIIGTVGKTGRATGPHLHWGATLNGTRFDGKSLLNLGISKDCSKT